MCRLTYYATVCSSLASDTEIQADYLETTIRVKWHIWSATRVAHFAIIQHAVSHDGQTYSSLLSHRRRYRSQWGQSKLDKRVAQYRSAAHAEITLTGKVKAHVSTSPLLSLCCLGRAMIIDLSFTRSTPKMADIFDVQYKSLAIVYNIRIMKQGKMKADFLFETPYRLHSVRTSNA